MNLPTVTVLLDLVLIMAAAHILGWLAEKLGQPPVIGEIAAGILAGPAIIGHHLSSILFPQDARSSLNLLANIGVTVFMFAAGLELDRGIFTGARRSIPTVSAVAYIAPFVLGSGLAVTVLTRYQTGHRLHFALYIGCALAVTAFPVLARILHDRNLIHTEIGQISLACAALVDIAAWTVLAVVLALAHPGSTPWRLTLLIPLVGLLWWVLRPMLERISQVGTAHTMIVLGISGALAVAAITEWIGLHLIFGAFAFGVIFPRERRRTVESGVHVLSAILLPGFFVVAGLAVDLSSIDSTAIGELVIIIAAAVLGKIGSVYLAARLTGMQARPAAAVAALLNTRGLTELVILSVGLTTGLIGAQLYSLLVVMALVTTASTAPILRVLGMAHSPRETPPAAHAAGTIAPVTTQPHGVGDAALLTDAEPDSATR
ncbi:cation:proton antiporter [Nocardia sp. NEAU-G5]|uniref:Cation:proton antiporter n=1 Tax=Nocardia albiluteola TaxID=2842303 RepID=A0ABS6B690_9NOCA|nr:cation:proton antiporter [Nocardia albiluteola]MBU3064708.1 cation:proton antiporter [Nocardia albiluteola]